VSVAARRGPGNYGDGVAYMHLMTEPKPTEATASPVATVLGCVGLVYGLLALGLPLYWVFTDSGLAAVVTDAQTAVLPGERYYPVLSWMCPTLLLMSPVFIAMMFSRSPEKPPLER